MEKLLFMLKIVIVESKKLQKVNWLTMGIWCSWTVYSNHVSSNTVFFFNFLIPDITAFPHSVNVLTDVIDDVRTPDKLIDGINDTYDGRHMWLSPILPAQVKWFFHSFNLLIYFNQLTFWYIFSNNLSNFKLIICNM